MNCRTFFVAALCLATCGLVTGCGSGAPAASEVKPAAATANLAGNWLLLGALPQGPGAPLRNTQMAVTFATVADQILGLGNVTVVCPEDANSQGLSISAVGYTFVVTGPVRTDGSFTTQSQSTTTNGVALPDITISGGVPASPGGGWSGSYVVDTRQASGSCPVQLSGDLSATSIAAVTGTYQATGAVVDGAVSTPVKISMVLQQGMSSTVDGKAVNQAQSLSGTIKIEGTSCFQSGVLSDAGSVSMTGPRTAGSVAGSEAFPAFMMDDGSLLVLHLYVAKSECVGAGDSWSRGVKRQLQEHVRPPVQGGHVCAAALKAAPAEAVL